jgi:hypothetical protein
MTAISGRGLCYCVVTSCIPKLYRKPLRAVSFLGILYVEREDCPISKLGAYPVAVIRMSPGRLDFGPLVSSSCEVKWPSWLKVSTEIDHLSASLSAEPTDAAAMPATLENEGKCSFISKPIDVTSGRLGVTKGAQPCRQLRGWQVPSRPNRYPQLPTPSSIMYFSKDKT